MWLKAYITVHVFLKGFISGNERLFWVSKTWFKAYIYKYFQRASSLNLTDCSVFQRLCLRVLKGLFLRAWEVSLHFTDRLRHNYCADIFRGFITSLDLNSCSTLHKRCTRIFNGLIALNLRDCFTFQRLGLRFTSMYSNFFESLNLQVLHFKDYGGELELHSEGKEFLVRDVK